MDPNSTMTPENEYLRSAVQAPPIQVSLDLEMVLASIHPYFLDVYNERFDTSYEQEDIDSWDWVDEETGFDTFNDIVDEGWRQDSESIEPTEPGLAETVERLVSHPLVSVDIVTARTGVEGPMKEWLSSHGITGYDVFHSTKTTKADLGYDVFIDDKPRLAPKFTGHQVQFMPVSTHNQAGIDHPRTIPVDTVEEATDQLLAVINQHGEEQESVESV